MADGVGDGIRADVREALACMGPALDSLSCAVSFADCLRLGLLALPRTGDGIGTPNGLFRQLRGVEASLARARTMLEVAVDGGCND